MENNTEIIENQTIIIENQEEMMSEIHAMATNTTTCVVLLFAIAVIKVSDMIHHIVDAGWKN